MAVSPGRGHPDGGTWKPGHGWVLHLSENYLSGFLGDGQWSCAGSAHLSRILLVLDEEREVGSSPTCDYWERDPLGALKGAVGLNNHL